MRWIAFLAALIAVIAAASLISQWFVLLAIPLGILGASLER